MARIPTFSFDIMERSLRIGAMPFESHILERKFRPDVPAGLLNGILNKLKVFFYGRPITKDDLFWDRLRIAREAGVNPETIVNFWEGIEELRETYAHHLKGFGDGDSHSKPS